METLDVIQGTPEWHAARKGFLPASEASAALGLSKYTTRNELLKQYATGITEEVTPAQQFLYDKGHKAESLARPIVERIIGESLFPCVGILDVDGLKLLASFDGLTMGEYINWETKLFNADLVEQVKAGNLDPHYWVQIEQQMLVSGAEKTYFTTSDGTLANTIGCWYYSVPERRAQLISGWKLFLEDLQNYQHMEAPEKIQVDTIEQFPVLVVNVEGSLSACNVTDVFPKFEQFLSTVNKVLKTDTDFAHGEANAKFSRQTAVAIKTKAKEVIAQISDVNALIIKLDAYAEKFDALGLFLEKAVKTQKDAIKLGIINAAREKYTSHLTALNNRIGKPYMPTEMPDFALAIKGKRTITGVNDAVDNLMVKAKLASNEIADRISCNLNSLAASGNTAGLFPDIATLVLKSAEDFSNTVDARMAAEAARVKEKADRLIAEQPAVVYRPSRQMGEPPAVIKQEASKIPMSAIAGAKPEFHTHRPDDNEIISALANHFSVSHDTVIDWISEIDLSELTTN